MVVVPGGRYVIGRGSEHREREAVIAPFLIDRYPVTRKQWQQFVPGNDLKEDEKDLPVANVTFFQANLYARWRGTRLPFEYEWESAASGPRGGLYPWGDTPVDACANCSEMQLKGPSPVGQFPSGATSCGAMDMIGNVSEWVVQDPDREKAVAGEIVKGGRFDLPITVMTCAWRKAMPAMTTHPVVGFRCAKDLDSGA
jgi:serine/threonine-protein kinase